MRLPSTVHIMEVGPRDGFQAEKQWIPTEKKIEIVNALSRTGVPEIQVTSFVHPKAIPQLADAEEVLDKTDRLPGVRYRALTPNLRGLQRALPFKPDTASVMLSVTESHNRANGNRAIAETLREIEQMVPVARNAGLDIVGSLICGFGCPFEGEVPFAQLEQVTRRYLAMGISRLGLADTIGVANPRQVYDTMARLLDKFPQVQWSLHLHNTRDMALANVVAAMQAGISRFDGAIGGLGGCPYAPGATGNVATEDLVNMLHEMGIETGVDLDSMIAVARKVQEVIPHPLDSSVVRAGRRTDLRAAPGTQHKIG